MPDAEERLAKAETALRIEALISERGLSQTQAASLMGLSQTDVADIVIRPRQDVGRRT